MLFFVRKTRLYDIDLQLEIIPGKIQYIVRYYEGVPKWIQFFFL